MVKNDTEIIAKALTQINEKMKMTMEIKENLTCIYNIIFKLILLSVTNEQRNDLVIKTREFDFNMLSEKEWKKCSNNVSLELHIDLIKQAYDVNNTKIYSELLQTALIRCKFRRIEVPYIVDLDIIVSSIPNPNIPNGYEKILIDINEAHLRTELAKIRLSMAKEVAKQQEEKRLEDLAATQQKKKPGEKAPDLADTSAKITISDPDPLNVTHNYIYFILKRSYLPDKAIYGIDVVMANEDKGPTLKMNEGWRAIAIPINQYTGVRETTKQIPFLLVKHSHESLKDEEEKKTLLMDFMPILCKSYLSRPNFGFDKINIDMRQVPQQFYRIPNLDFVYCCYK